MRYVTRRLVQAVFSMWAAITLTFVLIRLLPGGPIAYLRAQLARAGRDPSRAEELAPFYLNYEADATMFERYIDYMVGFVQLDFGQSIWFREPVADIVIPAIPWTVFITASALAISFTIGILSGALMAYQAGSRADTGLSGLFVFLNSIPFYVIAIFLLYVLGYRLQVFPQGGKYGEDIFAGPNLAFVTSVAYHAILPVASLVLAQFGGRAIAMRANSISELGADYVRVGRLRGLASNKIAIEYVGQNAVLPMYTGLLISIGGLFGGSIILETIFSYPGVGWYVFRGIGARDYPLMMAGFILITFGTLVGVVFADLTYGKIDPRAGRSGDRESYGSGRRRSLLGALVNRLRRAAGRLRGNSPDAAATDQDPGAATVDAGADEDSESVFETDSDVEVRRAEQFKGWLASARENALAIATDWRGMIGLPILAVYLLMATVGVALVEEPVLNQGEAYLRPMQEGYLLGTDKFGRSVFGYIVYATPAMLKMILAGAVFTTGLATVSGMFTGYVGGLVDELLTVLIDILMVIPGLPLIIILGAVFQPTNPYLIGILVSVNAWAGLARTIRSEVLKLRDENYVESMRIAGIPRSDILRQDILPGIFPYVLINFVRTARRVIFASIGLFFLGVFPLGEIYNWGVMLNEAYNGNALFIPDLAYWLISPMVAIIGLTLSLVLLAQSADKLFNARMRTRK
jgi:ABC-type dipeptide/oligopeptide/nickel transport system permease component